MDVFKFRAGSIDDVQKVEMIVFAPRWVHTGVAAGIVDLSVVDVSGVLGEIVFQPGLGRCQEASKSGQAGARANRPP